MTDDPLDRYPTLRAALLLAGWTGRRCAGPNGPCENVVWEDVPGFHLRRRAIYLPTGRLPHPDRFELWCEDHEEWHTEDADEVLELVAGVHPNWRVRPT